MADFSRNNLANASSPYLSQHAQNPVHWQEWNPQTLAHAKKTKKPLFVSIGYSTCHWCHVMAAEAFSDSGIARYLNENFVAIKVDREERPDIDQLAMSFITRTQGGGGWPLNIFMSADMRPYFAATYVPVTPKFGLPGFIEVLRMGKDAYERHSGKIPQYLMQQSSAEKSTEHEAVETILSNFDAEHGGFGGAPKFPPHCTLLFLISYFENTKDLGAAAAIEKTLDAILLRGLHDHLQGGFFRYCVDGEWTIPHFEKMLYDQAMLLWAYSAAYKALGKEEYKEVAQKTIRCLTQTFDDGAGMLFSGHDADTGHEEGAAYVWDKKEIEKILSQQELKEFLAVYEITDGGNFEGKNHLVKKADAFLPEIEKKLLAARRKRPQPFIDRKILTSWNCLAGIALLEAGKCLGNKEVKEMALGLFGSLMKKHCVKGLVLHSSIGGRVQGGEFLQDCAGLLLFATHVHEETGKEEKLVKELLARLGKFQKKGDWIESSNADFVEVPAQDFDHPAPSSVALAEMAQMRAEKILGKKPRSLEFQSGMNRDFHNLAALLHKQL